MDFKLFISRRTFDECTVKMSESYICRFYSKASALVNLREAIITGPFLGL
jgi:hypothetical protein